MGKHRHFTPAKGCNWTNLFLLIWSANINLLACKGSITYREPLNKLALPVLKKKIFVYFNNGRLKTGLMRGWWYSDNSTYELVFPALMIKVFNLLSHRVVEACEGSSWTAKKVKIENKIYLFFQTEMLLRGNPIKVRHHLKKDYIRLNFFAVYYINLELLYCYGL